MTNTTRIKSGDRVLLYTGEYAQVNYTNEGDYHYTTDAGRRGVTAQTPTLVEAYRRHDLNPYKPVTPEILAEAIQEANDCEADEAGVEYAVEHYGVNEDAIREAIAHDRRVSEEIYLEGIAEDRYGERGW